MKNKNDQAPHYIILNLRCVYNQRIFRNLALKEQTFKRTKKNLVYQEHASGPHVLNEVTGSQIAVRTLLHWNATPLS
jgi:hypothetical protein